MSLFKTSKEAQEILEDLRRRTTIRPNYWARAAFGFSLSLESELEVGEFDSGGQEFQENTFFGEDREVLLALSRQRIGRVPESGELGSLIKAHVERGIRKFYEEFKRVNRRGDEFLLYLIEQCAMQSDFASSAAVDLLPSLPKTENYAVVLELGKELKKAEVARHILNGPGAAPHLAIMGRNGTGKTRTGLYQLLKIKCSSSYPIPFLIFDYAKGDIASNSTFAEATNAKVVRLPGETVPIAPLLLSGKEEYATQLAARRFRDTICSVVHLGAMQKDHCLQLISRLYDEFGERVPDLTNLTELAEQEYERNEWRDDSLLACLREFSTFPLFRPAEEGVDHDLFKRTHILDIHGLPEDLRKLVSFLVLDRLYSEIMGLPDSPLDKEGNRQIRLIIVIDEAHHYLPCRQKTLQDMVREVRSKGVAIWLFSQSPDDFDQKAYNFAKEMGLSLIFSCVVEKPRMLEALLGGKIDSRRLSQLPPGVALTRIYGTDSPIEIQAWQP